MRVISLGSGSSGNSLLIEAGPGRRTKLLVDAGFPDSTLMARLRQVGVSPAQLSGILLTHEHSDHILGLPRLMKRYAVPVIADARTLEAIQRLSVASDTWQTELAAIDQFPDTLLQPGAVMEEPGIYRVQRVATRVPTSLYTAPAPTEIAADTVTVGADKSVLVANELKDAPQAPLRPLPVGSRTVFGDIEVTSFPVSHDAIAPCGYLLCAGGCRVCVVIDSGEVTPAMLEAMHQADLLVLESNHDREKLLRGPYPYALKLRILSPTGHLSNDQAADAVLRTWRTDSVRWLWLSHLSRTNNTPKIALNSIVSRLQAARANLAQVHITVLPPGMGGVWDSTQLWHTPSLWEYS